MKRYYPLLIVSLAGTLGFVISKPFLFGLCREAYKFGSHTGCLDNSIDALGVPLAAFALLVLPITVILLFVERTVFRAWLRFAAWYVPLSMVLIGLTPTISHAWLPLYFVSRVSMTVVLGGLFTLSSLVLIVRKTLTLGTKDIS